jgi:hypothetical protein
MYLQLLEGPDAAVQATYERIKADDRRLELNLLISRVITKRLFPTWAMRDDPARSWMWSAQEVAAGAISAASAEQVLAIFEKLAVEAA